MARNNMYVALAMVALLVAPAFGAISSATTNILFATNGVVVNGAASTATALTVVVPGAALDFGSAQAAQTTVAAGPTNLAASTAAGAASGRRLQQASSAAVGETSFTFATLGAVVNQATSNAQTFAVSFPGFVSTGARAEAALFTLAVGPTSFAGATRAQAASTTGRKLMQAGSTATGQTAATFTTLGAAVVTQDSAARTILIAQPGFVFTAGQSRAAVLTIAVGPTAAAAATRATSTSSTGK